MTVPEVVAYDAAQVIRPDITNDTVGFTGLLSMLLARSDGREPSLTTAPIQESFRALQSALAVPEVPGGGLIQLARLLGGAYLHVPGAVAGEDIQVAHPLGRTPELVVFSWDLEGLGGQVQGDKLAQFGSNEMPWTSDMMFVRVTRDSSYSMVVI